LQRHDWHPIIDFFECIERDCDLAFLFEDASLFDLEVGEAALLSE
jgi:hypothetical protein